MADNLKKPEEKEDGQTYWIETERFGAFTKRMRVEEVGALIIKVNELLQAGQFAEALKYPFVAIANPYGDEIKED